MTIGRHQRLIWGLLVAAMLAGAPEASAEIMVGFAGPLTGQMEYAGEQAQNGAELAIAELNAAGGVSVSRSSSTRPTTIVIPSRQWPPRASSWPTRSSS
jgi:hypothetical protein